MQEAGPPLTSGQPCTYTYKLPPCPTTTLHTHAISSNRPARAPAPRRAHLARTRTHAPGAGMKAIGPSGIPPSGISSGPSMPIIGPRPIMGPRPRPRISMGPRPRPRPPRPPPGPSPSMWPPPAMSSASIGSPPCCSSSIRRRSSSSLKIRKFSKYSRSSTWHDGTACGTSSTWDGAGPAPGGAHARCAAEAAHAQAAACARCRTYAPAAHIPLPRPSRLHRALPPRSPLLMLAFSFSATSLSWCLVLMCLTTYLRPTNSLLLSLEPHLSSGAAAARRWFESPNAAARASSVAAVAGVAVYARVLLPPQQPVGRANTLVQQVRARHAPGQPPSQYRGSAHAQQQRPATTAAAVARAAGPQQRRRRRNSRPGPRKVLALPRRQSRWCCVYGERKAAVALCVVLCHGSIFQIAVSPRQWFGGAGQGASGWRGVRCGRSSMCR